MIGLPELGVVLVIALVVFGPKKLPEVGKALGKSLHDFKEAASEDDREEKREKNVTPELQAAGTKQQESERHEPEGK